MNCRRCHGLMVRDRFFDSDEEGGLLTFWGWRCICCGEIIDPVILANRADPPVPRKRRPRYPRFNPALFSHQAELAAIH